MASLAYTNRHHPIESHDVLRRDLIVYSFTASVSHGCQVLDIGLPPLINHLYINACFVRYNVPYELKFLAKFDAFLQSHLTKSFIFAKVPKRVVSMSLSYNDIETTSKDGAYCMRRSQRRPMVLPRRLMILYINSNPIFHVVIGPCARQVKCGSCDFLNSIKYNESMLRVVRSSVYNRRPKSFIKSMYKLEYWLGTYYRVSYFRREKGLTIWVGSYVPHEFIEE